MMINKKKRGRGPLIAAVLLVSLVVVVLGLLVLWGRDYLNDLTKRADEGAKGEMVCLSTVNFDIVNSCYDLDNGIVRVSIDNKADSGILGLIFRLHYDDGSTDVVKTGEFGVRSGSVPVDSLMLESFEVEYNNEKTIEQIEIIPEINVDGTDVLCVQNSQSKYVNNEC